MNIEEQATIENAVKQGLALRIKYIGPAILTRGDFGEAVDAGWVLDGYVYVWDSDYGWFLWGKADNGDWETQ